MVEQVSGFFVIWLHASGHSPNNDVFNKELGKHHFELEATLKMYV